MMSKKRGMILGLTAGLILICVILLIIFSIPDKYSIKFVDIDDKTSNIFISNLQQKYPELRIDKETNIDKSDLVVSHNKTTFKNSLQLEEISRGLGIIPSAMRELTQLNGENIVIPLQLDHVELLIKNNILNSMVDENELPTYSSLIETLTPLKTTRFFPLLIAGKDDTSLLDLLSLLIVSYSNSKINDEILSMISEGTDFNTIMNYPINKDKIFKDLLDELIIWRKSKLIHTEWLQFDKETVYDFLEGDLAGAAVMRLSEHRTYETRIINKYTAIPFPTTRDNKYAADLLTIPLFVAIPKSSKNIIFSKSVIALMLSKEFQKELTYKTGMAPVNSTVVPLDKQSTDVRFWAASSNKIATAYNSVLDGDIYIKDFLLNVRNYLVSYK